jgi:hypothetical protein
MALGRDQDMFEESQMRAGDRKKEEENRDDKEESQDLWRRRVRTQGKTGFGARASDAESRSQVVMIQVVTRSAFGK